MARSDPLAPARIRSRPPRRALAEGRHHVREATSLASTGLSYYDRGVDLTTVSPKYQVVIPKRVREQFGLAPGQQLQVIALPGRIELVPSQPPAALRGFLQGENTFQREPDRL